MTLPQQPLAPEYAQPTPPKRTNGLGIAALILGILALIGSFIPFVNYGSGLLALIGLVLGIIGLFLKDRSKGTAIAGTIVSAIALILSIVLAIAYTAGFAAAVNEATEEREAAANVDQVLVYTVEGTATNANVMYSTYNDGSSGTESSDTALPFTKEITVKAGDEFDFSSFSIYANNGVGDTGPISCRITLDGEVLSEQSAEGEFASVSCNSTK
ncbi:MAG TPA: DUF4190 domain-containing protein [Naasia sp.]|jgi:hypothetical protein